MVGTIKFTYTPNNWTFSQGSWGIPTTTIPAPLTSFTVTHPTNFHACATGQVASWVYIVGTDSTYLSAQRVWDCVGAQ